MAKGKYTDIEKVLESNFKIALTHKMFEKRNKKITEYYDYGRYNIEHYKP